jgi:hypothetical protein
MVLIIWNAYNTLLDTNIYFLLNADDILITFCLDMLQV